MLQVPAWKRAGDNLKRLKTEVQMKKFILIMLLVWVSQGFATIDDLTAFINSLPEKRAEEAKILVINSQRSFLGIFSFPYYLIYRS